MSDVNKILTTQYGIGLDALPAYHASIEAHKSCKDVLECFSGNPRLPGLMVVDHATRAAPALR